MSKSGVEQHGVVSGMVVRYWVCLFVVMEVVVEAGKFGSEIVARLVTFVGHVDACM